METSRVVAELRRQGEPGEHTTDGICLGRLSTVSRKVVVTTYGDRQRHSLSSMTVTNVT